VWKLSSQAFTHAKPRFLTRSGCSDVAPYPNKAPRLRVRLSLSLRPGLSLLKVTVTVTVPSCHSKFHRDSDKPEGGSATVCRVFVWKVTVTGPGVGPCVSFFYVVDTGSPWLWLIRHAPKGRRRPTLLFIRVIMIITAGPNYCCCLWQQCLLYGTGEAPCTQGASVRLYWFLSFGKRTQNSRVTGARPNHQPHRGSGARWDPWGTRYFNTGCTCFPCAVAYPARNSMIPKSKTPEAVSRSNLKNWSGSSARKEQKW